MPAYSLVATTYRHLIAIDSSTGEEIWDCTNPDTVAVWTSPALFPDGSVLIDHTHGFIRFIGQG